MDAKKLKKVVEQTVEKEADSIFEDMQCHPEDYSELYWLHDEDDCWIEAIERAKDKVWTDTTGKIDEDVQEEMTEQNWHQVYEFIEAITWKTFAAAEVQRAFAKGVAA